MNDRTGAAESKVGALAGEAAYYLRAALDWIDAIPDEIAAGLPAMPGFERDAAERALVSRHANPDEQAALAEIGRAIADPMWAAHSEVSKRALKRWHKALSSAIKRGVE
ncbi:hypothetical protein ACODYM_28895 [Burkholderia gladioli]|uniref:hypothetical protein n=1 Tax=Burkholderia gladioli TaxID=28095 RepID=UPI003B50F5E4